MLRCQRASAESGAIRLCGYVPQETIVEGEHGPIFLSAAASGQMWDSSQAVVIFR